MHSCVNTRIDVYVSVVQSELRESYVSRSVRMRLSRPITVESYSSTIDNSTAYNATCRRFETYHFIVEREERTGLPRRWAIDYNDHRLANEWCRLRNNWKYEIA